MYIYISQFSIQLDIQPYTQPLDTQHYSFIMNNLIQTGPFRQNRYSWRSHFDNPYMHQVQGLCHLGLMSCRVLVFGIRVCKRRSTIECLHFALCNISLLSLSALCAHTTHTSILSCITFFECIFLPIHFHRYQELALCKNIRSGIDLQLIAFFECTTYTDIWISDILLSLNAI